MESKAPSLHGLGGGFSYQRQRKAMHGKAPHCKAKQRRAKRQAFTGLAVGFPTKGNAKQSKASHGIAMQGNGEQSAKVL